MGEAMGAHSVLLVGLDGEITCRFCCAGEDESGGAVGGKVGVGMGLVEVANGVTVVDNASGTGETSAVAADCGKDDACVVCGVEDEFIDGHVDVAL